MAGANLTFTNNQQLVTKILSALKHEKSGARPLTGASMKLCHKAGVPTTNSADDDPNHTDNTGNEIGTVCYDSTNDDVYICTAYTNSTTHTWTKVSA